LIQPLGYVVLQHSVRLDRPVRAYEKWMDRIPKEYRESILSGSGLSESGGGNYTIQNDPHKLAVLKRYRSLMPMAQEARKPMFHLKPADGAIGSHLQTAQEVSRDFQALALAIAKQAKLVSRMDAPKCFCRTAQFPRSSHSSAPLSGFRAIHPTPNFKACMADGVWPMGFGR
jgi:hypothetical protein